MGGRRRSSSRSSSSSRSDISSYGGSISSALFRKGFLSKQPSEGYYLNGREEGREGGAVIIGVIFSYLLLFQKKKNYKSQN
jgi:hypothetical protein